MGCHWASPLQYHLFLGMPSSALACSRKRQAQALRGRAERAPAEVYLQTWPGLSTDLRQDRLPVLLPVPVKVLLHHGAIVVRVSMLEADGEHRLRTAHDFLLEQQRAPTRVCSTTFARALLRPRSDVLQSCQNGPQQSSSKGNLSLPWRQTRTACLNARSVHHT
jgi:hypothetical protein